MSNKLVLLTTDTPHHLYYAWKVSERYPLTGILLETNALKAPFPTSHPFEQQRDHYEKTVLLKGAPGGFHEIAETQTVLNCNDPGARAHLAKWNSDVAIVFGTGRLKTETIRSIKTACLNLHGGDPEHYRGLDSHLWAIYHRDFQKLVTTLHFAADELDTGDVVGQQKLILRPGMEISQLRALNTQACVELSFRALDAQFCAGTLNSTPQKTKGRYYSFMPAVLKDACVESFKQHVSSL